MAKCKWCKATIERTGFKDSEGNEICDYCYGEAIMEARIEAQERKAEGGGNNGEYE